MTRKKPPREVGIQPLKSTIERALQETGEVTVTGGEGLPAIVKGAEPLSYAIEPIWLPRLRRLAEARGLSINQYLTELVARAWVAAPLSMKAKEP